MTDHDRRSSQARLRQVPLNVVRGFLIGLAELVPGVSGGTVALVVGVYERALRSALALGRGARSLVMGPDRSSSFRRHMREVEWRLVVPALIGMAVAVLFVAGPVESLVSSFPENSRGLFFGLVAASLIVPVRMLSRRENGGAGGWISDALAVAVSAAVSFVLVGLASDSTIDEPQWWFVMIAAAIAVCALVVPGVSGSFFLLAIGLYAPTLQAVAERDLGYIAVFGIGAVIGLLTVVKLVTYLLERVRRTSLLVMLGLMLGSLRALWPWQDGADGRGALLAPSEPLVPTALAVLGAATVIALIAIEHRVARRAAG